MIMRVKTELLHNKRNVTNVSMQQQKQPTNILEGDFGKLYDPRKNNSFHSKALTAGVKISHSKNAQGNQLVATSDEEGMFKMMGQDENATSYTAAFTNKARTLKSAKNQYRQNRLREFKLYKSGDEETRIDIKHDDTNNITSMDYFQHLQELYNSMNNNQTSNLSKFDLYKQPHSPLRIEKEYLNYSNNKEYHNANQSVILQEKQAQVDAVVGSMVLMNPSRMYKCERNDRVSSLMKQGRYRLQEIKLTKVVPDNLMHHLKDPVHPPEPQKLEDDEQHDRGSLNRTYQREVSLLNLTVKHVNTSSRRPQSTVNMQGFDSTLLSAGKGDENKDQTSFTRLSSMHNNRKIKSSQGARTKKHTDDCATGQVVELLNKQVVDSATPDILNKSALDDQFNNSFYLHAPPNEMQPNMKESESQKQITQPSPNKKISQKQNIPKESTAMSSTPQKLLFGLSQYQIQKKKLEENESNIIHELYDQHFGPNAHLRKEVVPRSQNNTFQENSKPMTSLESEHCIVNPVNNLKVSQKLTKQHDDELQAAKFVQYVPKKMFSDEEPEKVPNQTYFKVFTPHENQQNLNRLSGNTVQLNYHIGSGQILATAALGSYHGQQIGNRRCSSSHMISRGQCPKLKEIDVAELQSQAFKYQQLVLTSMEFGSAHADERTLKNSEKLTQAKASFFPHSGVPEELQNIMNDKKEFQRILTLHEKGFERPLSGDPHQRRPRICDHNASLGRCTKMQCLDQDHVYSGQYNNVSEIVEQRNIIGRASTVNHGEMIGHLNKNSRQLLSSEFQRSALTGQGIHDQYQNRYHGGVVNESMVGASHQNQETHQEQYQHEHTQEINQLGLTRGETNTRSQLLSKIAVSQEQNRRNHHHQNDFVMQHQSNDNPIQHQDQAEHNNNFYYPKVSILHPLPNQDSQSSHVVSNPTIVEPHDATFLNQHKYPHHGEHSLIQDGRQSWDFAPGVIGVASPPMVIVGSPNNVINRSREANMTGDSPKHSRERNRTQGHLTSDHQPIQYLSPSGRTNSDEMFNSASPTVQHNLLQQYNEPTNYLYGKPPSQQYQINLQPAAAEGDKDTYERIEEDMNKFAAQNNALLPSSQGVYSPNLHSPLPMQHHYNHEGGEFATNEYLKSTIEVDDIQAQGHQQPYALCNHQNINGSGATLQQMYGYYNSAQGLYPEQLFPTQEKKWKSPYLNMKLSSKQRRTNLSELARSKISQQRSTVSNSNVVMINGHPQPFINEPPVSNHLQYILHPEQLINSRKQRPELTTKMTNSPKSMIASSKKRSEYQIIDQHQYDKMQRLQLNGTKTRKNTKKSAYGPGEDLRRIISQDKYDIANLSALKEGNPPFIEARAAKCFTRESGKRPQTATRLAQMYQTSSWKEVHSQNATNSECKGIDNRPHSGLIDIERQSINIKEAIDKGIIMKPESPQMGDNNTNPLQKSDSGIMSLSSGNGIAIQIQQQSDTQSHDRNFQGQNTRSSQQQQNNRGNQQFYMIGVKEESDSSTVQNASFGGATGSKKQKRSIISKRGAPGSQIALSNSNNNQISSSNNQRNHQSLLNHGGDIHSKDNLSKKSNHYQSQHSSRAHLLQPTGAAGFNNPHHTRRHSGASHYRKDSITSQQQNNKGDIVTGKKLSQVKVGSNNADLQIYQD